MGDEINDYTVIRKLGSGGMGAVLLVSRNSDGAEFALKYCTDNAPEALRRFAREVRAMGRVSHPNVVPVIDQDLEHNPPYFVMPVAIGSLDAEIPTFSTNHEAALDAFLGLCDGVSAVHKIIGPHRDLKPHNTLRMTDNTVAVSDFGLVKIDPRDTTVLTRTVDVLGTNLYMAPEQRMPGGSRDAEHLVDVYSLGATLYHLLTGRFPAVIDTSDVPPVLSRIIKKATANVPGDRYKTVDLLAEAVKDYLRLLRNPKEPLRIFTERLEVVTNRLASEGKWAPAEVKVLLNAVRGLLEEPSVLIDEFDRIPDVIWEKAAKKLDEDLIDALEAYCVALDEQVGGRAWSYAELVAAKMHRVFEYSAHPKVRALAVRATLIAAVDLNRFAAMDTLEELLLEVKSEQDASAVADILREENLRFKSQVERYRRVHLQRLLMDVVREFPKGT